MSLRPNGFRVPFGIIRADISRKLKGKVARQDKISNHFPSLFHHKESHCRPVELHIGECGVQSCSVPSSSSGHGWFRSNQVYSSEPPYREQGMPWAPVVESAWQSWSGEGGGSISRGPAVPYWPAFPYYIFSCLHPLNAFLSSDAEQMKTYNNAADSMTYIFGGEGVTQYLLRGILERLRQINYKAQTQEWVMM